MKRTEHRMHFGLIACIALSIFLNACDSSSHKNHIKALVFSKTEGFRHASIEDGITALKDFEENYQFEATFSEDAEIFTQKSLSQFNVIIFLCTTGDILNPEQQMELKRFIQGGGGFVGIHSATDTEYTWPWYNELVGAYFDSHPPGTHDATIEVLDNTHPSTNMLSDIWEHHDEWYNFKKRVSNLNILLNLDETSYEGGNMGEDHPVAWYRDFDGGKSWYTALGHTSECYSDPTFLGHIWGGIQYVAGDKNSVDYNAAHVSPSKARFEKVVFAENLFEPMELEILPDRRILFIERRGDIKLYDPETKETSISAHLEVFSDLEDGLLGMALDPDYKNNKWVYLYYSPKGVTHHNLSRFSYDPDALFPLSDEKVVMTVTTQRDECCHSGGSVEFDAKGLLYLSTGDNTNPFDSDGFNPIDERPGRSPWDAQKSSANPNDLRGKILRIKPEANGTYSIPEGNLFPSDGSQGRPEIYVMGCRNPYRISIDKNGFLYWGDVGPDAGENNDNRGPQGHDEVNQARSAGFFGWPYFIGNNKTYHDYNFANKTSGESFDPENPVNDSPNNTGMQKLPPAQPAFIWYPYNGSDEFPLLGSGGRTAMAGPVFHRDDFRDNPARYPAYLDGKLLIYEWMRGWILLVTMNEEGDFVSMEQFLPGHKFSNPIDMVFGPDGDLFMLEYGSGWFTQNQDARLVHLKYHSENQSPIPHIAVDKSYGKLPLTIQFTASGSEDLEMDDLRYAWTINNETFKSKNPDLEYTFHEAGTYDVLLYVMDDNGGIGTTNHTIIAGNTPPKIEWEIDGNKSFYWDDRPLNYRIQIVDEEDGELNKGIDPADISSYMTYIAEGFDLSPAILGHQIEGSSPEIPNGLSLMQASDCAACHKENSTSIGPSFFEISNRYASREDAVEFLASKIIKGGGGNWGEVSMAAHPQISIDDASQIVQYILNIGKSSEDSGTAIPFEGHVVLDLHQAGEDQGKYVLSASYTDKGQSGVSPLSNSKTVILRNTKVKAATFDQQEKCGQFELDQQMMPFLKEKIKIVLGNDEGYVVYNDIDLTGVDKININYIYNPENFGKGTVSLKLDSIDGKHIGQFESHSNLKSTPFQLAEINLDNITGKHDLYLSFEASEGTLLCALYTIEFIMDKPTS